MLATNEYTAHLWEGPQGTVVPVRGQMQIVPGKSMPTQLPATNSFMYFYTGEQLRLHDIGTL